MVNSVKKILTLNTNIDDGRLTATQLVVRHALVSAGGAATNGLDDEAGLRGEQVAAGPAPGQRGRRVALRRAGELHGLSLRQYSVLRRGRGGNPGRVQDIQSFPRQHILFQGSVGDLASNLGLVVSPGNRKGEPGHGLPRAGARLDILLAHLGGDELAVEVPGESGGRVTALRHALHVQLGAGFATHNTLHPSSLLLLCS